MYVQIKDICKFINQEYNKAYGSVERINENLGKVREAKGILFSEGSSVDSFKKFASKINLSVPLRDAMIECYEKLDFCETLSKQIHLNANITEKVISKLAEVEHVM